MNINDAKITSLYVGEDGSIANVQDDAPNAPAGGKFTVTLEMVAGEPLLSSAYELITTCSDVTETAPAPPLNPGAPLSGPGTFASPHWNNTSPTELVFKESVTVAAPTVKGHVYRYTAALYNPSGQVVSIKQSDPFILL